jgi:hypothetical protein
LQKINPIALAILQYFIKSNILSQLAVHAINPNRWTNFDPSDLNHPDNYIRKAPLTFSFTHILFFLLSLFFPRRGAAILFLCQFNARHSRKKFSFSPISPSIRTLRRTLSSFSICIGNNSLWKTKKKNKREKLSNSICFLTRLHLFLKQKK